MDDGDSSLSDKDEEDVADALSRIPIADAPILLFVCFHKAFRSELDHLRRSAETASLEDHPRRRRQLILHLHRRFQFLRLALKYHCAAEDEVIFVALDTHVKNVACTYFLEHNCTNDLFDSIFHFLNELMAPKENISDLFQELVCCIGILQTSIYQHMLKEEEQVFPLLMQKLSTKEQASLVWQFICSVPITLLEEVLPWMVSFLSANKQSEVTQCLNDIAPMEKALQEVLVYWLRSNRQSFTKTCFQSEEFQGADGFLHIERPLKLSYCNRNSEEISSQIIVNGQEIENGTNQVNNVLHLWHNAIKKDLKEILKELYLLRKSSCFQNLDSLLVQLKFLADVLIFYSNAQKQFFHPVLNKHTYDWLSKSNEQFLGESNIEDIQKLLFYNSESGIPLSKFVEKLCQKFESFVSGVKKQFAFQENEVFPIIRNNGRNGMQERLLSLSLHMMPLGLLKCVITWFSVHLSEKESRFILQCIKKGNISCKAFSSLLHEWFRIGYSGKMSIENFKQDLQHIFKRRCSFFPEQMKEAHGFSFLNSERQPHKVSGQNCLLYSSPSGPSNINKYETPYSTGINLHIFFPATVVKFHQHPALHAANRSSISFLDDPKPIDLIFFFHKAIKKDLEYLVLGSAQLEENDELLMDFKKRFHLIYFLHEIHSDAEDEIVFPALEARGKLKNISHAYTFDHKHVVEHFNKISRILDKMSGLHLSISTIDSNIREKEMSRYHHLCRKLQEVCKSIRKLLSDHINREEIEIWPIIRDFFSNQEQGKIIGCMLGRIRAEILQDMIPWIMASLNQEEQHVLMFLLCMATKNTMFDEWLVEWWDGYSLTKLSEGSNDALLQPVEPLEIISKYLSEGFLNELQEESSANKCIKDHIGDNVELSNYNFDDKVKGHNAEHNNNQCSEHTNKFDDIKKHACNEVTNITNPVNNEVKSSQLCDKSGRYDRLLKLSQDELEMAIRRVSRDSCLNPQKKSQIIQNLLMSRWIIRQKISSTEVNVENDELEFFGKHPSYRDPLKLIHGCKHYKRNCKLFSPCCNQLHTCIHCHNEESDHSIDRKSITKMMCMNCLIIQPIRATCSTVSCNLSMAKYYCKICKLFDDEREIYHCPYCNLCRVGKGLGVDYFHCMSCNACMSRSLMNHSCREKHLEDNCPICHEYIFTSCSPVKALPCGHVMHSTCFQEYTCYHYTCPICSKSLGDMQVYFRMLDALLAEEKISDEISGQTQVVLCNDCEKKGAAPFHWLYHKCPSCGSYNTRLL
ncbi:hypothetical protein Fmac_026300 [Flemingia macrophylla]|uniref:Zinc finger protein BRUTUS-like n=1 Tax=Flemingia macrophylla TaxID=520843 RepID=A0ABD1LEN1_9FABA